MTPPATRLKALWWLWLCLWLCAGAASEAAGGPQPANHELLSSLGLVRRRVAPAHHRKRLAAEMRSGGAHDDSHMVLIKLPPQPYYYAHTQPHSHPHPQQQQQQQKHPNAVSKPALRFRGNGKPSAVYHWNLPLLKKMKAGHAHGHAHGRRGGAAKRTSDGDSHIYHIRKAPPPAPAHANEVLKGEESSATALAINPSQDKLHGPKAKISYYTPRRKAMFQKLFQGNGKPHSFYVIEKSKKPVHYHRLMP